jgi:hypothetical protein
MSQLHALIQYYRAIGAWGIAENLERIIRNDPTWPIPFRSEK